MQKFRWGPLGPSWRPIGRWWSFLFELLGLSSAQVQASQLMLLLLLRRLFLWISCIQICLATTTRLQKATPRRNCQDLLKTYGVIVRWWSRRARRLWGSSWLGKVRIYGRFLFLHPRVPTSPQIRWQRRRWLRYSWQAQLEWKKTCSFPQCIWSLLAASSCKESKSGKAVEQCLYSNHYPLQVA